MALPDFPNNPTLNEQFTVGTNIYQWDGEKWKALSNADNSLRSQLADVDSSVLVGGVEAKNVAKRGVTTLEELGVEISEGVYNPITTTNGKLLVISEDITLNQPLTIQNDCRVLFLNTFTSNIASAQDSNLYPCIIFDNFEGECLGNLKVEIPAASAVNTKDGVQIVNSSNFYIQKISAKNLRFHTITTNCSNYKIGHIYGNTARGWQGGLDDNGGSILTSSRCTDFHISTVTGDNIHKAAVYLSVDGNAGNNKNARFDYINVSMAATPVANGVAMRSAVDVSFGHIQVQGGISALYVSREEVEYEVDGIKVEKLEALDNSVASSNSFSIYCFSFSSANRVGSVEVETAYCRGSANSSVLIENVDSVKIGNLVSESPSKRSVQINGQNGSIAFRDLSALGASSNDLLTIGGSFTECLQFNTVRLSTRDNATIPLNVGQDTYGSLKIDYLKDQTISPAYPLSALIGSNVGNNVYIENVDTNAGVAVQIAGNNYDRVKDGCLFSSVAPASSNWYVGKTVRNTTPSSGQPLYWVNNGTTFTVAVTLP